MRASVFTSLATVAFLTGLPLLARHEGPTFEDQGIVNEKIKIKIKIKHGKCKVKIKGRHGRHAYAFLGHNPCGVAYEPRYAPSCDPAPIDDSCVSDPCPVDPCAAPLGPSYGPPFQQGMGGGAPFQQGKY